MSDKNDVTIVIDDDKEKNEKVVVDKEPLVQNLVDEFGLVEEQRSSSSSSSKKSSKKSVKKKQSNKSKSKNQKELLVSNNNENTKKSASSSILPVVPSNEKHLDQLIQVEFEPIPKEAIVKQNTNNEIDENAKALISKVKKKPKNLFFNSLLFFSLKKLEPVLLKFKKFDIDLPQSLLSVDSKQTLSSFKGFV